MDLSKLEIHLLALRDAADAAIAEMRKLKQSSPQASVPRPDRVAEMLANFNAGTWRKRVGKSASLKRKRK
jgi:hypothetical protein